MNRFDLFLKYVENYVCLQEIIEGDLNERCAKFQELGKGACIKCIADWIVNGGVEYENNN